MPKEEKGTKQRVEDLERRVAEAEKVIEKLEDNEGLDGGASRP